MEGVGAVGVECEFSVTLMQKGKGLPPHFSAARPCLVSSCSSRPTPSPSLPMAAYFCYLSPSPAVSLRLCRRRRFASLLSAVLFLSAGEPEKEEAQGNGGALTSPPGCVSRFLCSAVGVKRQVDLCRPPPSLCLAR